MSKRGARLCRRIVVALGLAALSGCSSSGFGTSGLSTPGFTKGTRGVMDGFVFVPSRSRQTASGETIPNAVIKVFQLRGPGVAPLLLATTQADAKGEYRVDGLPLNVPLLVQATDPFNLPGQPLRTVSGVISFSNTNQDKTRNLNETSTLAAEIAKNKGVDDPFSDQQVSALEGIAEQALTGPGKPDITADQTALDQLANSLLTVSFGTMRISLFSTPSVQAKVVIDGEDMGTVKTTDPAHPDQPGPGLVLDDEPIGDIEITVSASGFQTDDFFATVVAGEETPVHRVLVPLPKPGLNQPPVIVDERVLPPKLPFTGGKVAIQAIIRDPDGDPVTATAVVTLSSGSGSAARQTTLPPVTLTLTSNHIYSGEVTVPGNASVINQTYNVVIRTQDSANAETPTEATVTFQVAGTHAPPPPPSGRATSR